jgi:hypothetical protein
MLSFGESAGVRPAGAGEDFSAENAEITGPLPALVLASYAPQPHNRALSSHIVISSSVNIFDSIALHNTSLANSEYLLALFGDLLGNDAALIIQPKSLSGKTLGITRAQATRLGVLLGGALPLAILCAGMAVWLARRYK